MLLWLTTLYAVSVTEHCPAERSIHLCTSDFDYTSAEDNVIQLKLKVYSHGYQDFAGDFANMFVLVPDKLNHQSIMSMNENNEWDSRSSDCQILVNIYPKRIVSLDHVDCKHWRFPSMIHKVLTKTHLSHEISSKSAIITWIMLHRFCSDSEFPLDIFVYKMVNSRISALNKLSIPDGQNVRFAYVSSVILRYVAEMIKRPLRGQQTLRIYFPIEYPWW